MAEPEKSRTVRIPAPHPIGVRRTSLGVEVDVHSLVAALVTELAQDAPDEDAELSAIRDESGPARDHLLEELIDRLGGATIRLAARDAVRLAETLLALAGIPQQQDRRAS